MKKSIRISLLILTLIFSFSSLVAANAVNDVPQVLEQFEGDWSSILGTHLLTIAPLEGKDDRFQITLNLARQPSSEAIFVGEAEITDAGKGLFDYSFNPQEEAKYTGGTIEFIKNSIQISYIDKENNKHVLIFNKQAGLQLNRR